MMWNYGLNPMMGWGFGFFGLLINIFLWVLIIVAIVAFVRWLTGGPHHRHWRHSDKTPQDILKERYAKGEIDKKEYEEKMKDLS